MEVQELASEVELAKSFTGPTGRAVILCNGIHYEILLVYAFEGLCVIQTGEEAVAPEVFEAREVARVGMPETATQALADIADERRFDLRLLPFLFDDD